MILLNGSSLPPPALENDLPSAGFLKQALDLHYSLAWRRAAQIRQKQSSLLLAPVLLRKSMKAILGKKLGMTQMFQNDKVIPVTLIEAGPCKVIDRKTVGRDGYEALQVGYEALPEKRKMKSQKGKAFRYVREFRVPAGDASLEAQDLTVSLFQEGDTVKVSGISKGKGYAGAVKKWGVHGRNATHGVKHEERTIGSTGMSFPERVTPGKKMAGRMGTIQVTLKSVKIMKVEPERNILAVRGAIPGRPGTLLQIQGL